MVRDTVSDIFYTSTKVKSPKRFVINLDIWGKTEKLTALDIDNERQSNRWSGNRKINLSNGQKFQ